MSTSSTTRGSENLRPNELRSSGSNQGQRQRHPELQPQASFPNNHSVFLRRDPAHGHLNPPTPASTTWDFESLRPYQLQAFGANQFQARGRSQTGYTHSDSVFPRQGLAHNRGLLTPPTPPTPSWTIKDKANHPPAERQAMGASQLNLQPLSQFNLSSNYPAFPRADMGHDMRIPTPTTPVSFIGGSESQRPEHHRAVGINQLQLQSPPNFKGLFNLRVDMLRALSEAIVQSLGPGTSFNTSDWYTETAPRPTPPVTGHRVLATFLPAKVTAANEARVEQQAGPANKQPNDCFCPPARRPYYGYRDFTPFPTIVIITGSSGASSPSGPPGSDGSNQDFVRDARSWFAASKGTTRIVLIHTYNAEAHTLTIEKWQLAMPQLNVPARKTECSMKAQELPPLGKVPVALQQPYCSQRMVLSDEGLEGGPLHMHFQALMSRPPVSQQGERDVVLIGWDLLKDVARKL
ncbi:uncharacterized protein DSM5745_01436 [Aspergillus mulundensis]|uniref:Uncharacterized protein n=1 Tax=Aspergillus mulundensis TaxID=1810919 RepID=A0A3D8T6G7_9EURO|nr:hypothetical protein DSM5745_01436 [Aspergillus mulundensis]RDW94114.1 hypothetical protein DSM5745_01436 [Aspergillus mulundensis]